MDKKKMNENKIKTQNNRTLVQQNNSLRLVNQTLTQDISQLRDSLKRMNKETHDYKEQYQESERTNMELRRQLRTNVDILNCKKCSNKN